MKQPQPSQQFRTAHMLMWLEPPDLVCVRATGHIEEQDMLDMAQLLKTHTRDWPYVLLFVNQDEQSGISPEARKVAATAFESIPYRGTAFCSGSFALRTIGQLVMTMVNRLRGTDNPTKFFKTEAEARAFLEERQQVLRRSLPPTK